MTFRVMRAASVACGVLVSAVVAPSSTQTAVANGDTRTIHFYHTHTGESIDATFRVDGHYDPAVLRQLNHFLRDWRNNDETTMDPRLFDTLWEVYRTAGATQPIQIYSAYRSPETNAMLRRRSRAVAEHSQHMLGKAMDTTIPGFPMHTIREVGMRLQRGGVGWYPSANFVHLDVGGVRSWPRMSYEQLAQLFPDGKTVHIASNGQTLPGYEAARQEIAARGGVEVPPSQESGGFFAWLFGGFGGNEAKEDQEDRRPVAVAAAQPAPEPAPVAAAPQPQPETVLAYAGPEAEAPRPAALAERPQAEPEQVGSSDPPRRPASVESDAAEPIVPDSRAQNFPMPPRRPVDLVAVAEPEVPLPPIRPVALARLETRALERNAFETRSPTTPRETAGLMPAPRNGIDAIGGLISKTSAGVPTLRRSRLPTLVTRTPHGAGQALAFAPPEVVARDEVPDLRHAEKPAIRPVGLRSALRSVSTETAPVSASMPMPSPRLAGLRRAARELAASGAPL